MVAWWLEELDDETRDDLIELEIERILEERHFDVGGWDE